MGGVVAMVWCGRKSLSVLVYVYVGIVWWRRPGYMVVVEELWWCPSSGLVRCLYEVLLEEEEDKKVRC